MGALLEATVSAPPSTIALNLSKDIHWIRVSVKYTMYEELTTSPVYTCIIAEQ